MKESLEIKTLMIMQIKTRRPVLFSFAGLLALGLLALLQTLPPPAISANAPPGEFAAGRALVHIQALASEPRPFGSAAFAKARAYVVDQLSSTGLEPGSELVLNEESQQDPSAGNVVARIAGTNVRDAVLLVAHLDSDPSSPGAADDAAGIAVLLETARALGVGKPLHNSIILLITSQEELCCRGATAFINTHPWAKDVRLVINIDAGGLAGPALLTAISDNNGWLIHQYGAGDTHAAGNSAEQVYGESYDDFTQAFRPAGFPGYTFALFWDKRTHAPYDTVENVSLASIQHLGYHALALARYFGDADLTDRRQPNSIYFDVLRSVLISYPSSWAFPAALGFILLLGWVLWLGMRSKQVKLAGLVSGALSLSASAATAPVLVQVVWLVVSRAVFRDKHFEKSSFIYQIVMELIFVCLTSGLVILWRRFIGRRMATTPGESAMAVIALLAVVGALVCIFVPGFSYLFVWPLGFTLIALLIRLGIPPGNYGFSAVSSRVLQLIACAITVLVWMPRIVLDMFDLDMSQSYLFALLVVLFLQLVLAQLDLLFTQVGTESPSIEKEYI